jgi:hypothetical protein
LPTIICVFGDLVLVEMVVLNVDAASMSAGRLGPFTNNASKPKRHVPSQQRLPSLSPKTCQGDFLRSSYFKVTERADAVFLSVTAVVHLVSDASREMNFALAIGMSRI